MKNFELSGSPSCLHATQTNTDPGEARILISRAVLLRFFHSRIVSSPPFRHVSLLHLHNKVFSVIPCFESRGSEGSRVC